MRKTLVCIFAHPDDEAFGPGGTIAKFAKTYDIYILCATRGEAVNNKQKNLGKIREKELLESAKILGVKKVFFLDFIDGTLSNNHYHQLAEKIKTLLIKYRPDKVITFEPHGVSGHLDHIAVARVTTYVFEQLPFVKKLLYYCHTKKNVVLIKQIRKEYFVHRPDGYALEDIGYTCDISDVWETKVKAMKKHLSQAHDIDWILSFYQQIPKKEYFLVKHKSLSPPK